MHSQIIFAFFFFVSIIGIMSYGVIQTQKILDDTEIYNNIDTKLTREIVETNMTKEDIINLIKYECNNAKFKLSDVNNCIAFEYTKFIHIEPR